MLSGMSLDYEKIRRLREKMKPKMSIEKAAIAAGFSSRQQWHQIEKPPKGTKPNPKLETIEKIAGVLGVKVSQLLKD